MHEEQKVTNNKASKGPKPPSEVYLDSKVELDALNKLIFPNYGNQSPGNKARPAKPKRSGAIEFAVMFLQLYHALLKLFGWVFLISFGVATFGLGFFIIAAAFSKKQKNQDVPPARAR
jgi:hypothetical protein